MALRRRLLPRRFNRQKLLCESPGVVFQQRRNTLWVGRPQNQPRVVMLLDSQEHFRIVVPRSIWILLPRQREDHSGILLAQRRKPITPVAARNLDPRPLPPQVETGGSLDHLVDVSATHARRALKEIEVSVGMCANEFGMGDAAHQSQRRYQIAINLSQTSVHLAPAWNRISGE